MGFWDTITDLVEAATPWSTAEAEAPPAEEKVREFRHSTCLLTGKPCYRALASFHQSTWCYPGRCPGLPASIRSISSCPEFLSLTVF